MDGWVVVIVVAALAGIALGVVVAQRQRSRRLRSRFGPEYDRVIDIRGDRRSAERDLGERVQRREDLEIRPLTREARGHFADEWRRTQARFVDDPGAAVEDADRLVTSVMHERGYPVDEFDEQADLVSVDHPGVVEHYRHGHELFLRHRNGDTSTEELREAMVAYRALFRELLVVDEDADARSGGGR
jgi:hypothetical protein